MKYWYLDYINKSVLLKSLTLKTIVQIINLMFQNLVSNRFIQAPFLVIVVYLHIFS